MLIIALLFPASDTQHYLLHVVFVQPVGEEFSQDEMIRSLDNIRGAISFWQELSPIPITITISDTAIVTATDSIFNDIYLMSAWDTLYIVDNSSSGKYLFGDSDGWSTTSAIYVVSSAPASTYAHEFGHYYFALAHQYQESIDIMSLAPEVAYQRNFIGCASLAELGKPCDKVHIPIIR